MLNFNNKENNKKVVQLKREKAMRAKGRERFLARQEKNQKSTIQNNPHRLITNALTKVSEALEAKINNETEDKGRGRKYAWYYDLKDLDVDLLAYLGLNCCMDAVSIGASLTSCLTKIGKRVELETWALGLRTYDNSLANRIKAKVTKDHSAEVYRIKAAKNIAKKAGYTQERWTEERRLKVAVPILNAILEVSEVFDIWEQKKPKNTIRRIGLTVAASNQLAEMDYKCSWSEPMLSPLIVPPKDWSAFDTGCYLDEVTSAMVPLVRGASHEQVNAIKHQLDQGTPLYLEALNTLQATPLKINRYVLYAVSHCWDKGIVFGKFPRKNHLEHLKRPETWDTMSDFDRKGWSIRAREVREKNREIDGSIAMMTQDLSTAKELADFDEFWLGWNFDFRGRVYPVSHFNYHRDDHVKALFTLARGKTMDADAVSWLAVHIANLGDFNKISKQSLDDRIAWVEDNSQTLYQVGTDPIATFDYWSKADKPFQFLAACHELANYMDIGPDYVCSLPPQLDGTNSGVQHYAAASLNEQDGRMVNLVPADKPQDIYQSVATAVQNKLEIAEEPEAKLWLDFGVTRSTVKRNTMTYGYSSGKYGFGEQLYDDIMRPLQDQVMRGTLAKHPFGADRLEQKKACSYLAGINYESIQKVISSASQGMQFFQTIASALAHENKPVRFDTPIGFPMVQQYSEWDIKKVKIYLHDRDAKVLSRTQISIRTKPARKIDKRKARAAVSPNIIHSLDSAHLLMTVLLAKDNGVEDFFLIHDSFGTVPADTELMYYSVRNTFVELYDNWCLYKSVYNQATSRLTYHGLEKLEKTIEIPAKGTLNLTDVLESQYCFS